jgi:Rrf2 family protein
MKLNEGVEAAIHCTTVLASLEPNEALPASALADMHGLSSSYLVKHLMRLAAHKILRSIPGPKGGYQLAKAPEKISLADVVLAIEGYEPAFRCKEIRRAGPKPLPDEAYPQLCGINRAMLRAEKAYRDALAQTSLADLLADHEQTSDSRVIQRGCQLRDIYVRPQPNNRN